MPSQILLFSQPRSGCHLLERMVISKQTGVRQLNHPFWKDMFPLVEYLSQATEEYDQISAREKYIEEADLAIKTWKEALSKAESDGEILYMHTHLLMTTTPERAREHVQSQQPAQDNLMKSNCTLIPSELLLHPETIPVFTIRAPRSTVPSTYRAMRPQPQYAPEIAKQRELYMHATNLGWNRELYDWYTAQGVEPIIVDADDYMTNTDYVLSLCQKLGLNPDDAQLSWSKPTKEEANAFHPAWAAVQRTLINSAGIRPERASSNADLDAEMAKWKDEFGDEVTAILEECTAASMPHYEYLRAQKFRG
ncbi:hypothetical protein M409DRAFT_21921 [Zasmidium cellare ATCC 36951]|uniref:Sulfotransferase domain-containing protein n=1 Tax=Zasmidium cellare ATCC 36951 TaxID=1080233 RepID=A0A6A6CNQ7_ZASCE|nr:uncharacterized protein M409DRAFT_21921 [Zasmidium cellare ATCC 36951]KAF2167770.1 hypothetical protein M409DRAFT_21921 [Zasmidium cellare ATCC 36951]